VRCEYIRWGATIEDLKNPSRKAMHVPLRIASLGSDMHRDWKTMVSAFGNQERFRVAIASRRIDGALLRDVGNLKVVSVATADDVKTLYDWADIVVVSLKPNLHASGITVVLESVILGVPVVCTDTGGLRDYFSSAEICYVPIYAPIALRAAVEDVAGSNDRRWNMIARAQKRVLSASLTTEGFARRHRQLSEELLLSNADGERTRNAVRGRA